jgi:hypothetical protein
MAKTDRYYLIVQAQKYSDQEAHEISKWLCYIRDCDDKSKVETVETMLQAFINRKKLNMPVTIKQLEQEFKVGRYEEN